MRADRGAVGTSNPLSGPGYRIHRAVVADLDGAAEWYDAREPGLGLAFVDAVIAGIEAIVARPTAWQRDCLVAGREVRRPSPGGSRSEEVADPIPISGWQPIGGAAAVAAAVVAAVAVS